MKIFILDKNEAIIEFFKETFESKGADVIVPEYKDTVFNQIKKHNPDIVLCGYFLNCVNSLELLKFVKSNYPSIKFFTMSSYPFLDVDEILSLGADGFFQKDEGVDTIVEKIVQIA